MKKWINILGVLLLAQVVLAVAVNLTDEEYGAFHAQEKLLAFDKQSVDGVRIEDGEKSLVLKKRDGKWLLPESGDFPAGQGSVEGLLDKLAAMEKGWPVATTGSAARRFKVDEEQFERKLVLLSGDDLLATLYVGSSPGFRKVYVRPSDEDAIYAVAFNTWEASPKADDWIDKAILKLDESDVERIEMPGVTLQREAGKLQVADLGEKEQTNMEAARSLLGKLTGLRVQSLLGTEAKPEYRQEEPALELKVTRKGGKVLVYRFSKPEEQAYYVLKRSDLDYYFKVAEYTVDPIKETTREKLVQARTEGVSAEAVAGKQPEATAAGD